MYSISFISLGFYSSYDSSDRKLAVSTYMVRDKSLEESLAQS